MKEIRMDWENYEKEMRVERSKGYLSAISEILNNAVKVYDLHCVFPGNEGELWTQLIHDLEILKKQSEDTIYGNAQQSMNLCFLTLKKKTVKIGSMYERNTNGF